MRKTDTFRIYIFSDYPKKSNGSFREINFEDESALKNLDNAIAFLKDIRKQFKQTKYGNK